ncbi:hypothetical protein JTB14_000186 [Gonioctena quinquepunctata]|nr:hypothetical protein JTB14_000186 [Gonioctena quinquepunctata]
MRAIGQRSGGILSFFRMTKSPTLGSVEVVCHFLLCCNWFQDKYTQLILKWYEDVPTDTEEAQDSDDFSDAPSEHNCYKTDTEQFAESEVDDVQQVAANITEQISATAPRLMKKPVYPSSSADKPEIITFHNPTKGGVDVVDGMKCEYSVTRVSNFWPFTVLCSLLNIATINAQIIHSSNVNKLTTRRAFITEPA